MKFETSALGEFRAIQLKHQGKLLFSVAPDCGARILELNRCHDGEQMPVLWPLDEEDLIRNIYGKNDILFPFPNRLQDGTYSFDGETYQFPVNEPDLHNAIHGFVRTEAFGVKHEITKGQSAKLVLVHSSSGTDFYPFPFDLETSYEYVYPDVFTAYFEIRNTGSGPMPMGLGWHPYLVLEADGQAEWTVSHPEMKEWLTDERWLPTGVLKPIPADCIQLNQNSFNRTFCTSKTPEYVVRSGETCYGVNCSSEFSFLQLFRPKEKPYLAVEPMTCGINALKNENGRVTLMAGEIYRASCSLTFNGLVSGGFS